AAAEEEVCKIPRLTGKPRTEVWPVADGQRLVVGLHLDEVGLIQGLALVAGAPHREAVTGRDPRRSRGTADDDTGAGEGGGQRKPRFQISGDHAKRSTGPMGGG